MSHFVLSHRLSSCAMSALILTPTLTLIAPVYAEETPSGNMQQSARQDENKHTVDSLNETSANSNAQPAVGQTERNQAKASVQGGGGSHQTGDQNNADHDSYPSIGEMEKLALGRARPDLPIAERLNQLEQTTYRQTFGSLSLSERSEKLQETLLGENKQQTKEDEQTKGLADPLSASAQDDAMNEYLNQPLYQTEADLPTLEKFALELINQKRTVLGVPPLEPDKIAVKIASDLSDDLCKRNSFSHLNRLGENPDVRYTKAGGSDSLSECLAIISGAPAHKLNRALVVRMMDQIGSHQDELASLMSPAATNFGFSISVEPGGDAAIGCAEVVTKHAELLPIPQRLEVGGHLQIAGTVSPPYRFYKATLAWERDLTSSNGESDQTQSNPTLANSSQSSATQPTQSSASQSNPPQSNSIQSNSTQSNSTQSNSTQSSASLSSPADSAPVIGAKQFEQGEELPYFPPADYVAYEKNVPHDRTKLYGALKIAAVLGVIGAGVVVPGLPMAAPLILLIPVGKKPPISNCPIHAGVKVHGESFSGDIPVSDEQRPGVYYLTVWATKGRDTSALIPISRRAIAVIDAPKTSTKVSANRSAVDGDAQPKTQKRV